MSGEKPLILFIDAYDSFSNNIISLLETTLDATVRTFKIDDHDLLSGRQALSNEINCYTAVVCGPGPGNPADELDVGIMDHIWQISKGVQVPVLGICLGFQSLCRAFGGEVSELKGPQHGMIRKITHVGDSEQGQGSIFEGVGEIQATHYQSLCADIGHESMSRETFGKEKWNTTRICPNLVPLAWAEWDGNENDSGMKDERILVAVRHITGPFWALQYHPESICTNAESKKVIKNWFQQATEWNRTNRQGKTKSDFKRATGESAIRESLLSRYEGVCRKTTSSNPYMFQKDVLELDLGGVYQCQTVKLPDWVSVPDIVEVIKGGDHPVGRDQIVLESSNAHEVSDVRGRYSIIAFDVEDALRLEYTVGNQSISCSYTSGEGAFGYNIVEISTSGGVWPFLAKFLEMRRITDGNPESPFWGGFMGYTTYELGLEGIDVEPESRDQQQHVRPDLCLAWITKSIVVDHEKSLIYVQDIGEKELDGYMPHWMSMAIIKLNLLSLPKARYYIPSAIATYDNASSSRSSTSVVQASAASASTESQTSRSSVESVDSNQERLSLHQLQNATVDIKTPGNADYEDKVQQCQAYIKMGDSYELCLTDQTTIQRPRSDCSRSVHDVLQQGHRDRVLNNSDSWSLYRTLRTRQPAPFASYIRLGILTLISSSPERFLKWSADGECELRPMKGTVRKSDEVSTLEQAKALLDVPKEKAENLMIVDLVRHDLHSVCGSGNVSVPRLMVVEEYKSVFQMISIVQGHIPPPPESFDNRKWVREMAHCGRHTGLDVLAASLPPGSMTGAPKKRSCEILQEIEGKERSLYSGVVGYMDVGGRGDWSVTIRSMFRWDDEDVEGEGGEKLETWHIGAGGAVTALSTPVGEREEMQTKLNGTLGLFK
jgi:para-aminobenzoate synthetase